MTVYCTSPATLQLQTVDSSGTPTFIYDLMGDNSGVRVASLDIGFPTVREIVVAQPVRDGDLDLSRLYGPRSVTITGSFIPSAVLGSRQKVQQGFAYWVQPRLRPRLVYAVDADAIPVWLALRGSQLSAPYSHPAVSDFSVSWVAYDPVAKTLTTSSITINPGATGTATNGGTYRAWPILDVYGPCSNPHVTWVSGAGQVGFNGLTVASGHHLVVDTNAQTALMDGTTSVYQYLDFTNTHWTGLEPGGNNLQFTASSSSSPAHVVVTWADSYI